MTQPSTESGRRSTLRRLLDPVALGTVRASLWWNLALLMGALRIGTVHTAPADIERALGLAPGDLLDTRPGPRP